MAKKLLMLVGITLKIMKRWCLFRPSRRSGIR